VEARSVLSSNVTTLLNMTVSPILYVEDDENDAYLMRYAFEKAPINVPLVIVDDGQKALDYLAGTSPYTDRTIHRLPRLILLDMKLPRRNGLEVLKWIKTRPSLCSIPVVMLTSSNQEPDMHRAYVQGANGFLVKPGNPQQLLTMVKSIESFWLDQNMATNAVGYPPRKG
jgi:CheY-like chemotaxis protein